MFKGKNYLELIDFLPVEMIEGLLLGESFKARKKKFRNLVVQGMGGSGVTGEILECLLKKELKIPLQVNRDYSIPAYVDRNTLFIAVSYSGNTEETLAGVKEAKKKGAMVVGICSGGKLKKAVKNCILLPEGFPPRSAGGFLTVPVIVIFRKLGLIESKEHDVLDTILRLDKKSAKMKKRAQKIAAKLKERIPLIYAPEEISCTARKWQTELNENSKYFAHFNSFPEMNHNEVVGFRQLKKAAVIILLPKKLDKQMQKRVRAMKKLFRRFPVVVVKAEGKSFFEEIFCLLQFGSYVSYFLAMKTRTDPFPVKNIDYLKKALARK